MQAKAKERIQDTDQKILAEAELCKELTREHDTELAATRVRTGILARAQHLISSVMSRQLISAPPACACALQQVRDLVEETAKQLKNYEHDTELIKLQLKDKMHDVEKVLQQGKLVTMGEVKSEIKERYKVSPPETLDPTLQPRSLTPNSERSKGPWTLPQTPDLKYQIDVVLTSCGVCVAGGAGHAQ